MHDAAPCCRIARPLRLAFENALYHVTARGNGRAVIFLDDDDRRRFLAVLAGVVGRHNWLCHAYVLMGNHDHLMIETPDANPSPGMRQLNGVYTQGFSRALGLHVSTISRITAGPAGSDSKVKT